MIGARDPMGLVGQTLDGQYRVDEFIGEGGFSVVYRGFHTGLGEIVAIKCLKLQAQLGSALVESFVRRFRDEGRILYRLSQGNLHIVRSIASGTTIAPVTGSLVPYTVLEWLEGHSLAQDFDRRRAAGMTGRSPHEAAVLFATAFEAVAYAHEAGVIHRDLNPGNIFLTQTREGVRAKVLDFGVAKIISDHALEMGPRAATIGQIRMFSPAYAAPEQFDEKLGKPGPYTDVYTLSVVFMEALRDQPAIEGENLATLISQTLDENRRPTPRMLGLTVSDALENVFVRALDIHPANRPQTAGQLWVEIAAALEIRNVALPSPSPLLKTPPPTVALPRAAFGNQTVRMNSPIAGAAPVANPTDRIPQGTQPMASALAQTVAQPAQDGRFSATMPAPENIGTAATAIGIPMFPAPQPSQPHAQSQPQAPYPSQPFAQQQPYPQPQQQQQQQPAHGPPPPPILAIARDAGPPIHANETTGSTMLNKPSGSGKVIAIIAVLLVLVAVAAFALRSKLHLKAIPTSSASAAPTGAPSATAAATATTTALAPLPTAVVDPAASTTVAAPITATATPSTSATATAAATRASTHEPASPTTARASAAPVDPQAFDAAKANRTLATFDGILVSCTDARGQKGVAHVTFGSDGAVQNVVVDPPLGGTPGGDCVTSRYKLARAQRFEGPPATVDHRFQIAK